MLRSPSGSAIVGELCTILDEKLFTVEIYSYHYGLGGSVQQPYNAVHNEVQQDTNKGVSVHMYNGKFHQLLEG